MTMRDWSSSYARPRKPVLAANVVSTTQPLAAQAGVRQLLKGGNAVDAALAAAITLTVVEPVSNGIGSDLFAIVWASGALHGLNASGRSPRAWTREYFSKHSTMPRRGWNTVTVPGAVSGWRMLSERFGKLRFDELFTPAIDYARNGFVVSPTIAEHWASQAAELQSQPGFAAAFMPNGSTPAAGTMFRFPEMAETLEAIADSRGEVFYRGTLAEKIEEHSSRHGGAMTASDFGAHTSDWETPLSVSYRDYEVHEMRPNGQGIATLIALAILQKFDLSTWAPDSAESLHVQIEAVKLALADARRFVADSRFMEINPACLLDSDYIQQRWRQILPKRAQAFDHGKPFMGGTVFLAAGDASGMMVSLIQSNFMGFGSGVVVPGTGISLQNRGACFVLEPSHPNCVAPLKRPYQTIIPGFVTRNGRPLLSFGGTGGMMQAQSHVQMMIRLTDHGQNPQAAVDAPRFRVVAGLDVKLEAGFPRVTLDTLRSWGHEISEVRAGHPDFGAAQMLWKLDDSYLGASDSRRDGQAIGF